MPTVSIIMPTFNRVRFLPQAIESIRAQQFGDWELIIVDDGSTDETPRLIQELTADLVQPVKYFRQENQGAYAARNRGLDHATGKYIAFFDSDDVWLPHHLLDCVDALDVNADIDWVYGACRLVDADTQQVLNENSFYEGSREREFQKLACEKRGNLAVLKSTGILAAVLDRAGLYAGLQNSVIRPEVFAGRRFAVEFHNEGEDQLAVVRALAAGRRFAYLDRVHVIYNVHAGNSSGAAKGQGLEKRVRLIEGIIRGYEAIPNDIQLTPAELRGLRRRVSRLYFWQLGYSTLWAAGRTTEALVAYRRAMRKWPWDWRFWKTYALAKIRQISVHAGTPIK
jgi:hypothetical protein